jgi:hypothetical protein
LTVASANNIIITGDLTTTGSGSTLTGNAVLGLVANKFVRVQHQVTSVRGTSVSTCNGATNTIAQNNPTIDAAILALQHSFIVDNFDCGATMGSLTINGALVQKFRGPVGTGGNSPTTGYLKAYTYDDRLKYLAPPYLFDILQSAWSLARENECVVNGTGSLASQAC